MSVKVLHIVDTLGMGGAETWLMEVLRLWAKSGAGQMDFVATSGQRGLFDEEAERLGAKIHYIRYGRRNLLSFARAFRRVLREGGYDALHDHQDYASGWHFLLGGSALPPVRVTHVHNPWLHIAANYGVTRSRRLAANGGKWLVNVFATHICGTSSSALIDYGFKPGRANSPQASVLHCGFDVERFGGPRELDRSRVLAEWGWPPETRLVLFAGRLDRALAFNHPQNHKNSWLALNIARAAALRHPQVRLIMAGAGESREQMEQCVSRWGLADRLKIAGVRHDMPALMHAADVLLFPSTQEGLGMVAVEAQAAGLPVLASTAIPSEAMVIGELFHALSLSAPLESWVDALLGLLQKPRISSDVARDAIQKSAFSIDASADRLITIYCGR